MISTAYNTFSFQSLMCVFARKRERKREISLVSELTVRWFQGQTVKSISAYLSESSVNGCISAN